MTTIFRHTDTALRTERADRDALRQGQSALGSLERRRKLALYGSLAFLVVVLASLAAWIK